jgi:hypothetical protein
MSVHEVLSLQDPNFLDMHDWMTSSDNDESVIQIKDIGNASADSEISHEPLAEVTDHLPTSEPSHSAVDVSAGCSAGDPTSPKLTETIGNDMDPDIASMVVDTPQEPRTEVTDHLPTSKPSHAAVDVSAGCSDGEPNLPKLTETVSNMDPDVASMAVDTPQTNPNASKRPRSDTIPPPDHDTFKRIKSSEGVDDITQTPAATARFVGTSRSAIASRRLKQEFRDGTHVVNEVKRANFVDECRLADRLSQFRYEKDVWSVFHSKCGTWRVMAEPYSSTKFKQHVNTCKSTGKAEGHTTLTSFFGAPSKAQQKVPAKQRNKTNDTNFSNEAPNIDCPCSGITAKHDARVPDFITRTGAEGGGARSVTKIADELFKKKYADLSERKKTRVDVSQRHEWTFRFDRVLMAIFSTKCEKFVKGAKDSEDSHTCSQCLAVLRSDSRFKSGLRVPIPEDGNFRYLNEKYQGKSTAERYAKSQGLQDLLEDKVRHWRAALLTITHF